MQLVRNEAEIETVENRPVLGAYARREVPQPDSYDHILVYSKQSLPTDPGQAEQLLDCCNANNVTLHFVLEDTIHAAQASAVNLNTDKGTIDA